MKEYSVKGIIKPYLGKTIQRRDRRNGRKRGNRRKRRNRGKR